MKSSSWIVTRKDTGEVVGEFFRKNLVDRFDKNKVIVETSHEYLTRINADISSKRNGKYEKIY